MRYIWLFLLITFFGTNIHTAAARKAVSLSKYGADTLLDQKELRAGAWRFADSVMRDHPMLMKKELVSSISRPHFRTDDTPDFYLLLFVFILLGLIKASNPKYFQALLRSFVNPMRSSRQIKEQMQSAEMPNFLMNIFFAISTGAYLFYVARAFFPGVSPDIPKGLLILILIAGVMVIYALKYFVIKMTGWAFKVESLTEEYLHNVFLVNKIIAIVLLPFIVMLAFGGPEYIGSIVIVSFVALGIMILNRYIRSWQVFGSFFQYSRFHFFAYLCASEILPLAILMKLMVRGML